MASGSTPAIIAVTSQFIGPLLAFRRREGASSGNHQDPALRLSAIRIDLRAFSSWLRCGAGIDFLYLRGGGGADGAKGRTGAKYRGAKSLQKRKETPGPSSKGWRQRVALRAVFLSILSESYRIPPSLRGGLVHMQSESRNPKADYGLRGAVPQASTRAPRGLVRGGLLENGQPRRSRSHAHVRCCAES